MKATLEAGYKIALNCKIILLYNQYIYIEYLYCIFKTYINRFWGMEGSIRVSNESIYLQTPTDIIHVLMVTNITNYEKVTQT